MKVGALGTMSEEKTASTLTIVEREAGDSRTSKWATKRVAQVAVVTSAVLLLAIVACVIGFVVMAKQHAKEQRRVVESVIKFSESEQVSHRAEYITSEEENIEIDTNTKPDGSEHFTLFDYNRRLQVSKEGNVCFVTTLVDYPDQTTNTTESHSRTFLVDDEPVKSVAFLAPAAQELCEGSPVYWAHAGCPAIQGKRKKRQADAACLISSTSGGALNGETITFDLVDFCPFGEPNCCVICREGPLVQQADGTFTIPSPTGIYGASSLGFYSLYGGHLVRGTTAYCSWFLYGPTNSLFVPYACTGTLASGETVTGAPGFFLC